MIVGSPPSSTAIAEFVVPRSIPTARPIMSFLSSKRGGNCRRGDTALCTSSVVVAEDIDLQTTLSLLHSSLGIKSHARKRYTQP